MKRFLCVMLAVLLGLSMVGFADTVDTQAQKLFDLGILRGDGVSFQLDKTLTRAEALAFITRLMGDEATLVTLYANINETPFKDNLKDQWYTRYVNYGVAKGLINGYTDGTFKPQTTLTDKAFLKLLLVTLGHTYGTDFTWETVYPMAVQVGLIAEVPETETPIQRGDVVSLIYKALQIKTK